jgi:hypothetical protein
VWKEAFKTLGVELVSRTMSRDEFSTIVSRYVKRFPEGGLVREWLTTYFSHLAYEIYFPELNSCSGMHLSTRVPIFMHNE